MSELRSRTRLDPEVRRRQIAAAAARVFAGREPGDVSFEAVADEAGVSRSLVYSYFGDRGRLFAAAYDHEVELLDETLRQAVESVEDRHDRLDAIVRAYLAFAVEQPEVWHLIASASSSSHPAVQDSIDRRLTRISAAVGDGPSIRVLVRGVIGFLEGAATETLRRARADDDANATDLILELLWRGLSELDLDLAT